MVTDELVRTALHDAVGRSGPAPDLRQRVADGMIRQRRTVKAYRLAAAAAVACLLLAGALPGPRAAAANLFRAVFRIGTVTYVVQSGTDPVPPADAPLSSELDPAPDSYNRWFFTPTGPLTAEAAAAVENLGYPFRLPSWLPDDLPKRLQLPPDGHSGDPTFVVLAVGPQISVKEMSRGWATLQVTGTTKADSRQVTLGSAQGLEVRSGDRITYFVSIDSVGYTIDGPAAQEAVVRKIAESLAPLPH